MTLLETGRPFKNAVPRIAVPFNCPSSTTGLIEDPNRHTNAFRGKNGAPSDRPDEG